MLPRAHSRRRHAWQIAALAAGLLGGLASASASAGIVPTVIGSTLLTPTTTAGTTAPAPTTTAASTTAAGTTGTTTASTAAPPSTAPASTAPAASTTGATSSRTAAAAAATAVTAHSFVSGCSVSAVVLLLPGRVPVLVGPVAAVPDAAADLSSLAYAAEGSVVRGADVSVAENGCTATGPVGARAAIGPVALFGGAVAAQRVTLTVDRRPALVVAGLRVGGRRTLAAAGRRIPLEGWGYLEIGTGRPTPVPGGGAAVGALAIHLLQPRAGLPAGTVVLVSAAGMSRASHAAGAATTATSRPHRRHRRLGHRPLKVTPPLAAQRYLFPVVGPNASFGDSYGGFRGDVSGHWHHGDDIFAPLGTPVVAVASGTITQVGWDSVGGWRLWIDASGGDQFYYAHLSGYVRSDLHPTRVVAGQVVGFVGNTGDAFTTPPHLHFEIHPRGLLRLGYDGAVDPTTYLDRWPHLAHVHAPRPARPPLPADPTIQAEARYVWRELLAARHLVRHAPPPLHLPVPVGSGDGPPAVAAPSAPAVAAAPTRTSRGPSGATVLLLNALAALALLLAAGLPLAGPRLVEAARRRLAALRRPRVAPDEPALLEAEA